MASSLGFSTIQDLHQLKPIYNTNTNNQDDHKITTNMIQSIQKDMINPTRVNNNEEEEEGNVYINRNIKQNQHTDQNIYENPSAYDLNSKYNEQYQSGMQSYESISKNNFFDKSQSDELLTKLNYMIHILEEQQDKKSDHVIEEIILYCFLGVFIIYAIDSFAKVGRYTR